MRRTTLARGGALLTAATLALSLGAGPATADSTTTESGSVAPDTSFSPDRGGSVPAPSAKSGARASASDVEITSVGDATIDDFIIKSGVMGSLDPEYPYVETAGRLTFNYFNGAKLGTPAQAGGPTAWTQATVNGVFKSGDSGWVPMWANRPTEPYPGAAIPRRFGAGKMVLGPTVEVLTVKNAATSWTPLTAKSNTFYIRRDTWGTFKASHSGSTVSFGARARIRGTDGSALSAKTGYIQYASDGTWKTLKTLSLDSTGNGKWSYRTSKQRTYRFLVKRTSVINGMTIKLPKL